jgi:hypothetical protein
LSAQASSVAGPLKKAIAVVMVAKENAVAIISKDAKKTSRGPRRDFFKKYFIFSP